MKRYDPYAERPNAYFPDLFNDLRAQLACAWEEWSEQWAENDKAAPDAMKGTKAVHFKDNEIVVIGCDGSINHFRFTLERIG